MPITVKGSSKTPWPTKVPDGGCTYCGAKLNPNRTAYLEKSFKTNRWYKPGECPPDESQGGFPFGTACAKRVLSGG